MICNNVVSYEHRMVKLQYFENVVRYGKFFLSNTNLIETVLDQFIGTDGLHNYDIKLRTRVTYLFSRFIKELK